MRRMVDSNARLMAAGYNKLIEESKARKGVLKAKLKYVIKSITDQDSQWSLMAYNQLKQRYLMLSGVGQGDAEMKKVSLIKRITNTSHNLQVMAINGLKQFLAFERDLDDQRFEEYQRQMKEKDRILRRIMDSGLRF